MRQGRELGSIFFFWNDTVCFFFFFFGAARNVLASDTCGGEGMSSRISVAVVPPLSRIAAWIDEERNVLTYETMQYSQEQRTNKKATKASRVLESIRECWERNASDKCNQVTDRRC